MRKRKRLLLFIVGCFLVAGVLWVTLRNPEPQYEGRPLSYWVLRDNQFRKANAEKLRVEAAIRHIGTNGLPFLLKWIQYEQPAWRTKAIYLALRVTTREFANRFRDRRSETLAANSVNALGALGEQATPIYPELLRLLAGPPAPNKARRIALVLVARGTNALPVLISAMDDPARSPNRSYVLWAIRVIHPPPDLAATAVPGLLRCLSETNCSDAEAFSRTNLPHLASLSATMLGELQTVPDVVVPALIACLRSPDSELRWAAAYALGNFGTNAAAALPALIDCLQDQKTNVAFAAAKAIAEIGLKPDLMVPALAGALRSRIDLFTMNYLGTFGTPATNELPFLTNLLSDPVWQVQLQASNAIRRLTATPLTNSSAR